VNHKRVHRLYRLEGLQLRMRIRRRKHMCLHRGIVPKATRHRQRLIMDFVHDQRSLAPIGELSSLQHWFNIGVGSVVS